MSGLELTFGAIRREVGRMLGFHRDPANWGPNETTDVRDVIHAGLRQFYYPMPLDGTGVYRWKFMQHYATFPLASGKDEYDLPEDFSSIDGNIFYVEDDFRNIEITLVNEAEIKRLRQRDWQSTTSYSPRYAGIFVREPDNLGGTQYVIAFWPTPDEDYVVTFRYLRRQSGMDNDNAVPIGGQEHAETIRSSCLAAAESHLNDEQGHYRAEFQQRLAASIEHDRKTNQPSNLGYNSDKSDREKDQGFGYIRTSPTVTYEKFPK